MPDLVQVRQTGEPVSLVKQIRTSRPLRCELDTRKKRKCLPFSTVAATKDLQAVYTFLLDPGRIRRELPYSSREQAFKFLISPSNIAAVGDPTYLV